MMQSWEIDAETRAVTWTERTRRFHEIDEEFEPTLESTISFYHPDDQETIRGLVEECIETGDPYSAELRLITATGDERRVRTEGEAIEQDGSRTVRGYIRDVTSREGPKKLEHLEHLNSIVRTIGKSVVQADTREEIAHTVCESLLEFEQYQFVDIGEFRPSLEEFERWAWASTAEFEDLFATVADVPFDERLEQTATETGELQVNRDASDRSSGRTCEQPRAAIPLLHENTVHGVVSVYADQPEAFGEQKWTVLTELGEIVGYALSALERKEVLDFVTEIEFRSEELAGAFPESDGAYFEKDSLVVLGEDSYLEYWTVKNMDACTYRHIIEQAPAVEEIRMLQRTGNTSCFEAVTSGGSVAPIIHRSGGELQSLRFSKDEAKIVCEFPEATPIATVIQEIRENIPDLELSARRRVLTPTYLRRLAENSLTERQFTVLKTAYSAGYFDTPRLRTGQEISGRLDITKQTFHNHLRKAEKRVFRQLFEPSTDKSD